MTPNVPKPRKLRDPEVDTKKLPDRRVDTTVPCSMFETTNRSPPR